MGRQKMNGELPADLEGALWTRAMISCRRVMPSRASEGLHCIVVGVDPPGSYGAKSDEVGIVIAGADRRDRDTCHSCRFEYQSARMTPRQLATRAVKAFDRWKVGRIVAEGN